MHGSSREGFLAVVLLAIALGAEPGSAEEKQQEQAERGRYLYEIYCMNCHGADAAGDGPTAPELTVPPSDLTRIGEPDGGGFPFQRVYRTIDGREQVPEHTPSSMPIWGLTLQELDRDTDQEDEVRRKILLLIEYLKSIQRP